MKTAKEILDSKFNNFLDGMKLWVRNNLEEAMKEYAQQFIDSADDVLSDEDVIFTLSDNWHNEINKWSELKKLNQNE